MNAKDLLIRIKSLFDGDGVAQAQKGIEAVAATSEQTGRAARDGPCDPHPNYVILRTV